MSINTLEKRASATNYFIATVAPTPDGTIGPSDRIQVGGEYSGIPAALIEYPTITLRERIIRAVIAKVADIQITKGYNTDCGTTVLRAQKNVDPDNLPFICIWPQVEEKVNQYGKMVCSMPLRIECLIEYNSDNKDTKVSKMLSDLIENILGTQWTLPFWNGSIEINVGDTIIGETSLATGYVTSIEITSGTWEGNNVIGNLTMRRKTGTFQTENLKVGEDVVASTIWNVTGISAIENTTNNLADSIECDEGGTIYYPDDGTITVGTVGIFNIKYSQNMGDPYNN